MTILALAPLAVGLDVLLALGKALAFPATGIAVALVWGAVWLWRHPDLDDCFDDQETS